MFKGSQEIVHEYNNDKIKIQKKQGRIYGHQLRMGRQGRICAFSHFSTQSPLQTDQPTDQPTNRQTDKASYRVACQQPKKKEKTKKCIFFLKLVLLFLDDQQSSNMQKSHFV